MDSYIEVLMGSSALPTATGSMVMARSRSESNASGIGYGYASTTVASTVDLLVRANQGDQSAWDVLVERHRQPLKLVARRHLPAHARSITDTDDVVQDALVRSMKHLRHFECRGRGTLLAYLRRAVINRVIDEIRRYARQCELVPLTADHPGTARSPLDQVLGREKAARYRAGLMRLGVRDRQIIVLRVHHRLAYQDIADRLGMCSPAAARVASMRALWRLSAVIKGS